MALIVDGEEAGDVKVSSDQSLGWESRPPTTGSAPSSIHSSSSSGPVISEESSVLESFSGRTRDRILALDNGSDKAGGTVRSPELWKLPDDRFDGGDPVCNFMDFENAQLNETLKSLMETKTPMLPSRVRTGVKPQQRQFSRPSATFVEPRTIPTRPSVSTSTHGDALNYAREHDPGELARRSRSKQSVDIDRQSDANAAGFTSSTLTEFADAAYQDISEKLPVQSNHSRSVNLRESHEAFELDGRNVGSKKAGQSGMQSLPSEPSSNVQSSIYAAAAAAESELFESSAPARDVVTSPILTVPGTDSLDSLIARYRNLRHCSAVAEQGSDSKAQLEPASCAEHLLPSSMPVVNLPAAGIGGTLNAVNQSNQATAVAASVIQQSADSVGWADRAAADDLEEEDLCNDNFDDIRMSLQNVSVDSAHTPGHAGHRQSGELFKLIQSLLILQPCSWQVNV